MLLTFYYFENNIGDYKSFRSEYVNPIEKSFREKMKLRNNTTTNTGKSYDSEVISSRLKASYDIAAEGVSCLHKLHHQV